VKFRGPSDLTEVWEGYSISVEEVRSSGGAEPSIPSHRSHRIYTWHRVSEVRKLKLQVVVTRPTISRSAISQQDPNHPFSRDTCQEIRGSRNQRIRVSENRILRQLGITIRDIPMGESCGPQQEIVEDRWHSHIGDREKVSPESFDIQIRDPASFEIPTR
jgi:hypothetical protein